MTRNSILLLGLAQLWAFGQDFFGQVQNTQGQVLSGAMIRVQSSGLYGLSNDLGNYQIASANSPLISSEGFQWQGQNLQWQQRSAQKTVVHLLNSKGQILWNKEFIAASGKNEITISAQPEAQWILFQNQEWGTRIGRFQVSGGITPELQALALSDSLECSLAGYQTQYQAISPAVLQYNFVLSPLANTHMLPETGFDLSTTNSFGEDHDYSFHPMQYQKNADGTVLDLVTQVLWTRSESPALGAIAAQNYCDTLSLSGQKWRLPDAHEAYSIQNLGKSNPSLDSAIWGKSLGEYWWTSSVGKDKAGRIWLTNMGGGIGSHDTLESKSAGGTKTITSRCVAGTAAQNTPLWQILSDSTALDQNTGLEWLRMVQDSSSWESALQVAENLNVGGQSDWRLPNIKELQSINDENRFNPSVDTLIFPNLKSKWLASTKPGQTPRLYWSSTSLLGHLDSAWTIDYQSGLISYNAKSTKKLFWLAVRGGK